MFFTCFIFSDKNIEKLISEIIIREREEVENNQQKCQRPPFGIVCNNYHQSLSPQSNIIKEKPIFSIYYTQQGNYFTNKLLSNNNNNNKQQISVFHETPISDIGYFTMIQKWIYLYGTAIWKRSQHSTGKL